VGAGEPIKHTGGNLAHHTPRTTLHPKTGTATFIEQNRYKYKLGHNNKGTVSGGYVVVVGLSSSSQSFRASTSSNLLSRNLLVCNVMHGIQCTTPASLASHGYGYGHGA
jgi:hypothetical protein